jgi:predicted phosphodiesterase
MKIQLASDLHLEMLAPAFAHETLIQAAPEADLLVLAGDIHAGTRAIERFKDWPVPVLYVAGNHEFYGHAWEPTRLALREACAGTRVRFLDNDRVDIAGVRFLGCTLWTDFRLEGVAQRVSMAFVQRALTDYRLIQTDAGIVTAEQTLQDHERSRHWLARELDQAHAGKTVVVTHHGPHPLSVHPRYLGNPLNGGFVSDMTPLLDKADLWLHGHVHDSFDYAVGPCRVVANPAGYILNRRVMKAFEDGVLENADFDGSCVLELGDV